jgi:hypothetical protein
MTLEEAEKRWKAADKLFRSGDAAISREDWRGAYQDYNRFKALSGEKRDRLSEAETKTKAAEDRSTRDLEELRVKLIRSNNEDTQKVAELLSLLRTDTPAQTISQVRVEEVDKGLEDLKLLAARSAMRAEDYQAAQEKLRTLKKKVELAVAAQPTWKRNGTRPTFARVYIGDGNSLDLVSLRVTVTVDGPRARTVVDQVFHNPHAQQLEGTFEYPLPGGASASYFAMFLGQTRETAPPLFVRRGNVPALPADALVSLAPADVARRVDTTDWGRLQEAHVVPKEKALETYEDIVRGRIDPALLEYAAGNTFRGRVFPIPAKGYNRVLLAYEELLPMSGGKVVYQFPLPGMKLNEMQFSLQAASVECKEPAFLPREATKSEGGGQLLYQRAWKDDRPEGEITFSYAPARPQVQTVSGRHAGNGPQYVYARIRPELPKIDNPQPFAAHAVFLLDTSLSEHPDRFALNMKLLRRILENDPDIKDFNILAFNIGSAWVEPNGWLPNTKAGREQAFARLDGVVLEGATDLSAALDKLAAGLEFAPGTAVGTPLQVFLLSDGQNTWGKTNAGVLAARYEGRSPYPSRFCCYRTGQGAENLELYQALARRGGGIYHCFGEAELDAAASAHRRQCLHIERLGLAGGPTSSDLLVAGRQAAVYPGGELLVAAKLKEAGRTQLVIEGTFQGQRVVQEYAIDATGTSELAGRGWAEIAVASLLAVNDPKLDEVITAYCQEFGIGSRVASFLVLENEADYKRLNLEAERGKTISGDLGRFLEELWTSLGTHVTPREAFERLLARIGPRVQLRGTPQGAALQKLMTLLRDADFELPEAAIAGALLHKTDVAPLYLMEREKALDNASVYLAEAERRAGQKDIDGAVRVLSSVIEKHASRSDALRLVGYRLLDLQRSAAAVRLFQQVQESRPFEPHSYRDLARSLEASGKYGLAAAQYEIILAGTWHNRFGNAIQTVAREEYAHLLREALNKKAVAKELAGYFGDRLEQIAAGQVQSDLRVTISWNTDATDVDLWVIEPSGIKCFYQNNRTPSGGELSQDQTQGYGPERYQIAKAGKGAYRVLVHYYHGNPNLLSGETHVNVVVTRYAGTPRETIERHTVILQKNDQAVEVCTVEF